MAELAAKFRYWFETAVAIAVAVWAWVMLRSVAHGERLASIDASMVKTEQLHEFAAERREAFNKFQKEQEERLGELRHSMMQTFHVGIEELRRQHRKMHLQNLRILARLEEHQKQFEKGNGHDIR